jgi:hypothetical protein
MAQGQLMEALVIILAVLVCVHKYALFEPGAKQNVSVRVFLQGRSMMRQQSRPYRMQQQASCLPAAR